MATTTKWLRGGTLESLLTTGLNSLANNGLVLSSAVTITDSGYVLADVELVVTFGTNPTANTGISVWFLREVDGSTYEDGDASTTPARAPDLVLPVRATTSAQRIIVPNVLLPPGTFKALIKNDGTGQAFASSGNTLKLKCYTTQAV